GAFRVFSERFPGVFREFPEVIEASWELSGEFSGDLPGEFSKSLPHFRHFGCFMFGRMLFPTPQFGQFTVMVPILCLRPLDWSRRRRQDWRLRLRTTAKRGVDPPARG